MVKRQKARFLYVLISTLLLTLATAFPAGATPPGMKGPPVHDVTGCVRGTALLLGEPQTASGMGGTEPFRIVPCVNAPFDFNQYNGKLIRAQGELDRQDRSFICPKNVIVLGECPPGLGAPPPESDSTPCGTIDMEAVSVPGDFEVTYVSGPAHADWGGRTTLAVTAKGDVTEKEGAPGRSAPGGAPAESVKTHRISPDRVKLIYGSILACRFFELQNVYAARGVMDGGSESLRVRAGGQEHTVSLRNARVERFSRIVSTLMGAIAPAAGTPGEPR
jgi:hypothetical protein